MRLKWNDPFVALVDFMAFMVLISVFLFIISESNVPIDDGSKANVFSYRVTTKSATDFSQEILVSEISGSVRAELEFSLWFVEEGNSVRLARQVLNQPVILNSENQSEVFGIAPEEEPTALILSFSHLENLNLVGTIVELAIDAQFGKKSCSVDWVGQLGIDPGVLLDFDRCIAS